MYKWYYNSEICYAYLSDVTRREEIVQSRWFKRGWTLQELIAPADVIFFSKTWIELGSKLDYTLSIHQVSQIEVRYLKDRVFDRACIALKMSWASGRETSRIEDMAYCLMGLFDVNMPLLYGEGEKAFIRLQEAIIENSDDMSIFAWKDPAGSRFAHRGLLARSPNEFKHCAKMISWTNMRMPELLPYAMTNKGLRIIFYLSPNDVAAAIGEAKATSKQSYALLGRDWSGSDQAVSILLQQSQSPQREDYFLRVNTDKLFYRFWTHDLTADLKLFFGNGEHPVLKQFYRQIYVPPKLTSLDWSSSRTAGFIFEAAYPRMPSRILGYWQRGSWHPYSILYFDAEDDAHSDKTQIRVLFEGKFEKRYFIQLECTIRRLFKLTSIGDSQHEGRWTARGPFRWMTSRVHTDFQTGSQPPSDQQLTPLSFWRGCLISFVGREVKSDCLFVRLAFELLRPMHKLPEEM